MITLALQPAQKFDKEGVLIIWERQDGFFKRSEREGASKKRKSKSLQELSCYAGTNKASMERWCRLRGNLLFYMKTKDQWSEPVGVIVLLHCTIRVDHSSLDGTYGFFLVFEGGVTQHIATHTEQERDMWLEGIQIYSYNHVRSQLVSLQEQLELKQAHDPDLDVQMWRIRKGHHALDTIELPLCEVSLCCDNLLCDGHGRPPRPVLVLHVYIPKEDVWLKYTNTEIVEKSSNPSFLKTVCFWPSDGLTSESCIRITAYDVREKFSGLATPLGSAKLYISTLLNCQQSRFRVQLLSCSNTVAGFVTLTIWRHERESSNASAESTPCRSLHHSNTLNVPCHRRTQSLPSRFNVKQKIPNQGHLQFLFANALLVTYRFHSGLGGDISVHEIMAESKLCFYLPQQLLEIFMNEEKELLQEVAGMGELVEPWNSRQLEVLDRHLQLLHLYSQAKENLKSFKGSYFKPSSRKSDRSLEFAPINLHLQRLWVQNDTLKKSGFYDIITVGAFTAHSHKSKNGGLIKLIQQLKESPMNSSSAQSGPNKITLAYDAIQAIKLLRREVVDGMKKLLSLAKKKQSMGMLPICEDMISKTRILLSLWDPGLVEEALNFIEDNKVTKLYKEEQTDTEEVSQFKKIAQQISLNTKRPEYDDLMSPIDQNPPIWNFLPPSKLPASQTCALDDKEPFVLFPDTEDDSKKDENFNHRHQRSKSHDENGSAEPQNGEMNKKFLDTHAMCSSPSANYYKPTDEPEPWDLTQLNIEASVMCLVSKVKFLCGKCGSPAVRLRSNQTISRSQHSFKKDAIRQNIDSKLNSGKATSVQNGGTVAPVRNKFTEGLDFDSLDDWTTELKPSMRKLRQAMDGLLKTARLTHSVFRIQEDRKAAQVACNIRYRRLVCFSQALTALVSGLLAKLWCQKSDPVFLYILMNVGLLVEFEGLLSYYGDEIDMWGDMVVAVEDLSTVTFTLVPTKTKNEEEIYPKVMGSRSSLRILLPVPEGVFSALPLSLSHTFRVTPIFFNIGINEMATLAESLNATKPQEQSNIDNFDKLNEYYHRFKKLNLSANTDAFVKTCLLNTAHSAALAELMEKLKTAVHANKNKNVEVLHLASQICRKVKGLRFTSCKSAKDRTGMAVTLEQTNILHQEYDLTEHEFQRALDCMRSEGVRRENTFKNIGVRKYAFNSIQVSTFPKYYRPPSGTYGSVQS